MPPGCPLDRYEATVTLTVSIKASDEEDARTQLSRVEDALARRDFGRPFVNITYVESAYEIDCMEEGS